MYGIFDGHDGFEVAKYALDTIAAEVLLNQLEDKVSDEDVKTVLKYASLILCMIIFVSVTSTSNFHLEMPSMLWKGTTMHQLTINLLRKPACKWKYQKI